MPLERSDLIIHDEQHEQEQDDLGSDTSSIGVCSDEEEEEEEVQSTPIEDPQLQLQSSIGLLDDGSSSHRHSTSTTCTTNKDGSSSLTCLDSLEDSLPFKRGLSNFYSGKSKSFTTLSTVGHADATAKDLVKPDNPLNKRRRLLIAFSQSHNRRASCTSLVSIAECPLLPPPVLSECEEEEEEVEVEVEVDGEAMGRRSSRPSLFTLAIARQAFTDPPFLTPKPIKMPLRSPARSFSLSDLNRHARS